MQKKFKEPVTRERVMCMRKRLDDMIDDVFIDTLERFEGGLITRNELMQEMIWLEDTGALTRP